MHFLDARGPEGMRLYAIGDVHGRLDLLQQMHERIGAQIEQDRPDDWRVIHLGDYIDRGPDSRGVIDLLIAARARDSRYVTLAGNHDLGLLEFLAEPSRDSLFMEFGGIETAASYGVTLGRFLPDISRFHGELAAAVKPDHIRFIQSCGFSIAFGDFFFCHAGVRPGVALNRQAPEDLIWIRKGFLDHAGLLEKVIVHGHTIAREPEVLSYRVNIDTGAYRSGTLTALRIDGDRKQLISVSERQAGSLTSMQ